MAKKNEKPSHQAEPPAAQTQEDPPKTLVVDIGATGIKATVLNDLSRPVGQRLRRETPPSGMPGEVMDVVESLAKHHEPYDRVAIGFPGVIINGIVKQAPKLAPEWQDYNIAEVLEARLKRPVRVANDADVQGFGAIAGTGVELVVTLGTGVGTSLFIDGRLVPNVELGKDKLSDAALQQVGKKQWNKRLSKFIQKLEAAFHFNRLYIGGGNSCKVDVTKLPANVTVVSNLNGLIGGIALWRNGVEASAPSSETPKKEAQKEAPKKEAHTMLKSA